MATRAVVAPLVVLQGLLLATAPASAVDSTPPLPNPVLQQRYLALTHELRCMVCQGEALADSGAPLAVEVRREVHDLVLQGLTERQVRDHMVARYGEFILYKPPMSWRYSWLWGAPPALMLIGVLVAWRVLRARRALSDQDHDEFGDESFLLMTGLIVGAACLVLVAVLFVVLPLLGTRAEPQPARPAVITAVISALALIAVSAVTYALLGNPAGVRAASAGKSGPGATIAALARRIEQHPEDLSSWAELGAAYASTGQFGLALRSYERANQLAHGDNANVLADIGEVLLMRDGDANPDQAASYLNRALSLDPETPKALFYSALIAYRAGQLQLAHDRFQALLSLTPPPPANLRVALQHQIDQIDAQLHPQVDAATAIHLRVELASALTPKVPPHASLFVFVRAPDGGPPLAVKRTDMKLPQDVDLSASDAMVPSRSVQPGQKVTVVARISASGGPLPQSGDLYGQIDYVAGKTGPRALEIDKLTP